MAVDLASLRLKTVCRHNKLYFRVDNNWQLIINNNVPLKEITSSVYIVSNNYYDHQFIGIFKQYDNWLLIVVEKLNIIDWWQIKIFKCVLNIVLGFVVWLIEGLRARMSTYIFVCFFIWSKVTEIWHLDFISVKKHCSVFFFADRKSVV